MQCGKSKARILSAQKFGSFDCFSGFLSSVPAGCSLARRRSIPLAAFEKANSGRRKPKEFFDNIFLLFRGGSFHSSRIFEIYAHLYYLQLNRVVYLYSIAICYQFSHAFLYKKKSKGMHIPACQ